jgi:hypothetical protein
VPDAPRGLGVAVLHFEHLDNLTRCTGNSCGRRTAVRKEPTVRKDSGQSCREGKGQGTCAWNHAQTEVEMLRRKHLSHRFIGPNGAKTGARRSFNACASWGPLIFGSEFCPRAVAEKRDQAWRQQGIREFCEGA